MNHFSTMNAFVQVAQHEGFAPAARALGISTSTVSRQVMELESWLGVQLFRRTTRRLSLTEMGRDCLERCTRLLDGVDELAANAQSLHAEPRGELRITAPVFMGKHLLGPLLPEFLDRYPKVTVQLHLIDRFVNLVDEGFDVALRIGELEDSTLIARKIGTMKLTLTAAPGYLDRRGVPTQIRDLKNHNCLVDTAPEHGNRWRFSSDLGRAGVPVKGNISVNSGEMIRELALAGTGIAALPDFFVAEDVAAGKLVPLLTDHLAIEGGIFAVYPTTRHLSSAVRVLIDFLAEPGQPKDET